MGSWNTSWRAVICLFVAVVFAIAATPGSMAMPIPAAHAPLQAPAPMAMAQMAGHDCCPDMGVHQDHAKPVKTADHSQGKPCKNMAACLGLLNCFGMGAVAIDTPFAMAPPRDALVAFAHQTLDGLTHRPDHPPPIA